MFQICSHVHHRITQEEEEEPSSLLNTNTPTGHQFRAAAGGCAEDDSQLPPVGNGSSVAAVLNWVDLELHLMLTL